MSNSNIKIQHNGYSSSGDHSTQTVRNSKTSTTSKYSSSNGNFRSTNHNSPRKSNPKGPSGAIVNSDSSTARPGFSQVQKSDIRMGTGGMMSIYGSKVASSQTVPQIKSHSTAPSQGPPKPPRSLETQNSDTNLGGNDRMAHSKSNGTSNHVRQHQSNTGHRVDSIIHKMEALSTYGSSSNTNNSNIQKEKIYESVASRNRRGISSAINGFHISGSQSSNSNPLQSYGTRSRQEDGSYDHINPKTSRGNVQTSVPGNSPRSAGQSGGRAPAALPLTAVLNGYSLQRSQTHSHITTHSLERDSRPDTRRVSQESAPSTRVR